MMTTTVALHHKALDHIQERLAALNLDVQLLPFDDDGNFSVNGKTTPAAEVDVDYMWMSYHAAKNRQKTFDTALDCKSIKVLQTFNAGLDDPVYRRIADKGTRICNSSAQAVAISEYVMAQALAFIHPVDVQREQQLKREWKLTPFRELSAMHWLIIGYGPIGQQICIRAKAFGTEISVIRRTARTSANADHVGAMKDLQQFVPRADVIVMACPLNDATRGFADDSFFDAMKPDTLLINIARGALIDDDALTRALDGDRLAGAVLDVFHEEPLPQDNPLWAHPKVRLTPHTSFGGNGVRGRWDQLFLDNIVRYTRNDTLLHEVNPDDIA